MAALRTRLTRSARALTTRIALVASRQVRQQVRLLLESGLFDVSFYWAQTGGKEGGSAQAAARHFLATGAREGRNPHPLFDTSYYLESNPVAAKSGANPLIYFLRFGAAAGHSPHPLFDASYYLAANPDVADSNVGSFMHFLRFGAAEGRDPHPLFDTSLYVERYGDVARTGINPLVHFLRYGAAEKRDPHPLFDTSYYLESNPDVAESGVNPLVHFLRYGAAEGRDPHPLFDASFYVEWYGDVARSGINPLVHFVRYGAAEGRNPHPLFEAKYYLEENADVETAQIDPLAHFLEVGGAQGRKPGRLFDSAYYLEVNPEVAKSGVNPLVHYLREGANDGLDPNPLFDTSYYLERNLDVARSGLNPLVHYAQCGAREGRNPSPLFDTSFYLERYGDAVGGLNPLAHYLEMGGFEGLDPSPLFESDYYLEQNRDVAAAGLNPLVHFVRFGAAGGRLPREGGLRTRIRELLREGRLDEARDLFQAMRLDFPTNQELRTTLAVQIGSVEDELRSAGTLSFYRTPGDVVIDAPRFLNPDLRGEGGVAPLPPEYLGTLEDVVVIGGTRLVIVRDNFLVHDEMARFASSDYGPKALSNVTLEGKSAILTFRRTHTKTIKQGILLSCEHEKNYFHWLVECLPKLLFAESCGIAQDVPFLVVAGLHENLVRALEATNLRKRPIVELNEGLGYRVEKLYYPADVSRILDRYDGLPRVESDCVLSPNWIRRAAELVGRIYTGSAKRQWRKLYLTRRNASYRKLRNEAELELMLLEHGFEISDLTGASLESQVALFRETSIVVAPTGAAVTNVLFCQPGTRFVVLTSDHESMNFYIFSQLARIMGVELEYVVGRRLHNQERYHVHDDYVINTDIIRDAVSSPRRGWSYGQQTRELADS